MRSINKSYFKNLKKNILRKQNVTITWFSTRGKGELLKTETVRTDGRGRLTLTPPDKGADWAYRVESAR